MIVPPSYLSCAHIVNSNAVPRLRVDEVRLSGLMALLQYHQLAKFPKHGFGKVDEGASQRR